MLQKSNKIKNLFIYLIIFCVIFIFAVLSSVFKGKLWAYLYIVAAILSSVPFFLSFEKNKANENKLVLISVLISITVVSRIIFFFAPSIKPMDAIIILSGIYLGKNSGFMIGALSIMLSNFYYGQGPFTIFQMFTFGLIGFLAAIFSEKLKNHFNLLIIFSALMAIFYSLTLDVYTVLWEDNYFNFTKYIAKITLALPVTASYIFANILFISILAKPFKRIITRIKVKYII